MDITASFVHLNGSVCYSVISMNGRASVENMSIFQ